MDRSDYLILIKTLKAFGGKWDKVEKAVVFPDALHVAALREAIDEGEYVDPKSNGYFPTPEPVVWSMIAMADLEPEMTVLEPSAGKGAIAIPVAEIVGYDFVAVIDILPENIEALDRASFDGIQKDFLECEPPTRDLAYTLYDRVMMNPPFLNYTYAKHILHAWKFVKPGGRLISIAPSSIRTASSRFVQELRKILVDNPSQIMDNSADAFSSSGTLVSTVRIRIDRPLV